MADASQADMGGLTGQRAAVVKEIISHVTPSHETGPEVNQMIVSGSSVKQAVSGPSPLSTSSFVCNISTVMDQGGKNTYDPTQGSSRSYGITH